jgi:protease I
MRLKRLFIPVLILAMAIPAFVEAAGVHKEVLMIVAPHNFRDEELFVTKRVLESRGARVFVTSLGTQEATGMLGGRAKIDLPYQVASHRRFAAVVLVGGSGATVFWDNPRIHYFLRKAYREGAIIAAICISPVTLCRAGLLKGRKATVWSSMHSALEKCGARYTGNNVEVDGRIVTANGPWAAKAFANAILRLMGYM